MADVAVQEPPKMVDVLLSVIFHAALQPQNGKAGQCGGIEFRKDSDILLIRIQALCLIPVMAARITL